MRDFFAETSRDDLSAVAPATRADMARFAVWTILGTVAAGALLFYVLVKFKPD